MNRAGWAHSLALVSATCVVACGQTSQETPSSASTGGAVGAATGGTSGGSLASGGTIASTGGASVIASGGSDAGSCGQAIDGDDFIAAPFTELPTRLEGTLCGARQALWIPFIGNTSGDVQNPIRAQLVEGVATGTYTVTLFGVENRALQPLPNLHETNVFELNESAPELVFGFQLSAAFENRVVLKLEGPEGAVALDLDRPDRPPPNLDCTGGYESLPVKTPPHALPAVLETEFCNYRDSRTWAIEVVAGRPVTVNVENPWSIEAVDMAVYRTDVDDYSPLPVTEGVPKMRIGLLAHPSFRFTPEQSGIAALYGSLGQSRGEAGVRLRVEQE